MGTLGHRIVWLIAMLRCPAIPAPPRGDEHLSP